MIYFDHNSTSPYSPSVRGYIEKGILEDWHNPSSIDPQSQVLHHKIRECRKTIADYLNCSSRDLFFTSGGTESINTILSQETLKLNQLSGLVTSYLEHNVVIKKINYLSKYQNIPSHWILNNNQGEINLEHLERICSKNPRSLLSFVTANNETGVISDIESISKIAKKYNCLTHLDAVQSLGKMSIDLEKWNVDFISFSGHKIGSMKGVGLLYAKKPFSPLMYGGGQERGLRSGTYNYPSIQSFNLAIQDIDLRKTIYVKELRDYLEDQLTHINPAKNFHSSTGKHHFIDNHFKEAFSSFKINCNKANRLSNTSSIYCGGVSNQSIILTLAQKGICISAGSACNAGSPEPSHVIVGLNDDHPQNKEYARSCIRVSLAPSNTREEINFFISTVKELFSLSNHADVDPSIEVGDSVFNG